VLVPTRELAAQVLADFKDLATHTPVMGAAVFGGVGHGPQEHAFRSGVQVIIATPGRLLDHLRSPYAKLDHVSYLVLDEADRMLDMGFLPEIRKILKYLPARRQTLFFSATMPPPIRAGQRHAPKPGVDGAQRQSGPPSGDHAGGLSGRAGTQVCAAGPAAPRRRHPAGARVHSHETPRRIGSLDSWRRTASRWIAFTATDRRHSGPRRSARSRPDGSRCWWRPTSRRAASTSTPSGT
jgi:hypothetical protein